MTSYNQEHILANGLLYLAAARPTASPTAALVKEAAEAALRIIGNRNEAAALEKLIFYLISPKDIIVARQKARAKYAQINADLELVKSCALTHTQYYT
jgi:hypothetical protein